jgi:hypothetical protein
MAAVFNARFRVTWPYFAGGYPNNQQALDAYNKHQSALQSQVARTIAERLGPGFHVENLSARPFEPSGIELTVAVEAPSHEGEIDSSLIENVVRELGCGIKEFFQLQMPGAPAGANAYDVDCEFWLQKGGITNVGLPVDANDADRTHAPLVQVAPQLTALTPGEVEELLAALARTYLKPYELATRSPELRDGVERLLATSRFLRAVSDRPDNSVLSGELGREIEMAPVSQVIDGLRDVGMLDALDNAPRALYANLPRTAIPREDLDLLRRAGVEDPEAELTLMLYRARDFAAANEIPSEVVLQAGEILKRQGGQMRNTNIDVPQPKKRKLFNGIGKILTGLVTGAGNALLAAGTIAAPNPATAFLAIGSGAIAIGSVSQGVGDLRGE